MPHWRSRPRSAFPGRGRPTAFIGWLLAKQSEFYRGLSGLIRAAKSDGSAVWGLFGLSFAYGISNAAARATARPSYTSYLVANEETWRRGVVPVLCFGDPAGARGRVDRRHRGGAPGRYRQGDG